MVYLLRGINPPISVPEIDDEMLEQSTEYIFSNGVFGFNNENHQIYATGKRLSLSKLPWPLRKAEMIAKKVFIPYKRAKDLPYCSFVHGRRYLLPAAWIYRIYYIVKKRRDSFTENCKALFGNDDLLDEHKALMTKWGL